MSKSFKGIKQILLRNGLITLAILALGFVHTDAKEEGTSYSVAFDEDNIKVAKITVSFTAKDRILFMDDGAEQLEKRWATFVHHLQLTDEEGKPLDVRELPDAKWKILAPLNQKVRLTYEVHLEHPNHEWSGGIDGIAYATDMGVFYTGRTLFIMNGKQRKDIAIDFQLPDNWDITTPWSERQGLPNAYTAISHTDLTKAMIFAGTHKELVIKRNDFELLFALGSSEVMADEAEFRNLAEGVLDYYIQLMGGIPNPTPDNPFNKAVVVISSREKITDGEVIGNNISILIEKDPSPFAKTISRFIFAHEFFHLWNGKSFRPSGENAEWFKEGFTNYYTLKALHQVKFLSDESYLDFLSNFFYQRYREDSGLGTLSMTKGEEKHDHWGLIYGGGMLVGICQDLIIREAHNNEKSLDVLMKSLFEKYGGTDEGYTLEDLQQMMSKISGKDQTDFFNTYIIGAKKIPVENYLRLAGFDAQIEEGSLHLSKKEERTQKQDKMMSGFFGQLHSDR